MGKIELCKVGRIVKDDSGDEFILLQHGWVVFEDQIVCGDYNNTVDRGKGGLNVFTYDKF